MMGMPNQAIILITLGRYVRMHSRIGDEDTIASEAKTIISGDSSTGGIYTRFSHDRGMMASDKEVLTSDSDKRVFQGQQLIERDLRETLTESDINVSREDLLTTLVTAIMPNVECILVEGQLDLIKERSAEIGAINARLDSMTKLLAKLEISLDEGFEKFDSIKSRF